MLNNENNAAPKAQPESSAAPQAAGVPKPITDLSPRVVELARAIDRLPPGVYEISLDKPSFARDWQVEIVRTEKIRDMTLTKYQPE